jgi:aryl-phospho-beta-D-glucosidase BglC (GH1 family)
MKHPTDSPIPIRGLNLGGWLVLEKWMTPELFEGTTAEDEYHLLLERGSDTTWLTHHRDTFITKADFQWIRDHGIDTIRLPVGHWTYNAPHPYLPCDSYVEQAFAWAEETGLQVLLDVHAAPGCQNGFDNGTRIRTTSTRPFVSSTNSVCTSNTIRHWPESRCSTNRAGISRWTSSGRSMTGATD